MIAYHVFPPLNEGLVKHFSKESGITLPDLLVGTAIASMVGGLSITFLSQQTKTVNKITYASKMRVVAKQIEAAAGRPDVLAASATLSSMRGNFELRNCIGTSNTGKNKKPKLPCTITNPKDQI